MTPVITLTRSYPLGTRGLVTVYLEHPVTDELGGGTTQPTMWQARLVQDTDNGVATVTIPGVISTLYPYNSGEAYVIWQENLLLNGQTSEVQYKYETPVALLDDDDAPLPKDVDDPTSPLRPLWAGSTNYGIAGVRVVGSGLVASTYLGDLILELQNVSGLNQTATASVVDDETLELRAAPIDIKAFSSYAIIDPYSTNCEIRQVTDIDGATLTFERALKQTHSQYTVVLFTYEPAWWINLFGAVGGGTANDTPAVLAAKSDISTAGGTIRLPEGVWCFNLIMDQHGLRLIGSAKSSRADVPNYVLPWDNDEPVVTLSGIDGDQEHDMVVRDMAFYGADVGTIGLYIGPGTYNVHIDHISSVNFIDHCLKIGDINQGDLVSKIHINGAVLQASGATPITLGIYGNTSSRYTTAIFINNLELQQVDAGTGFICDGAPNVYFSNSYFQLYDDHAIEFRKTGSRSFPHVFMDNCAVDNGDGAEAVSIRLIAGIPNVQSYLSGTYKVVGKVAVQTYLLTESGTPTGGTFTVGVAVDGGAAVVTAALPFNVTADALQTALRALSNVGGTNITVTRTGTTTNFVWTVTPAGTLVDHTIVLTPHPTLTGGSTPTIAFTTPDRLYTVPGNMAAALRDPWMLEPWVSAAMRFADINNPEFTNAPNIQAVGNDLQLNAFGNGRVWLRPGNRDTNAPSVWTNLGLVLASYIGSARPVADLAPGALIHVSNEAVGVPLEFSTNRTYVLTESGSPTGGNFTIKLIVDGGNQYETVNINHDATAADVQFALQALTNVLAPDDDTASTNNLTVKRTGTTTNFVWTVTPGSPLRGKDMAFSFNTAGLTGGSSPTLAVTKIDGAWQQLAGRNVDNGFLVGQGFRALLSASVAAAGYFPGFTTDTTNALYAGRNDADYAQPALRGMSGSGYGGWFEAISGYGLLAKSQTQAALQAIRQDTVGDSVSSVAKFIHRVATGTAVGDGIGVSMALYASTDNGGAEHIDDPIWSIQGTHPDADYASFTGDARLYLYTRESSVTVGKLLLAMALDPSTHAPMTGFNGVLPVGKYPLHVAATDLPSALTLVNDLRAMALANGQASNSGGGSGGFTSDPLALLSGVDEENQDNILPDPENQPLDASAPNTTPAAGGGAASGIIPDETYSGGGDE